MKNLDGISIVGAGPIAFSLASSIRASGYGGVVNIFTGVSSDSKVNNFTYTTKNISPKLIQDVFIRSVDKLNYKRNNFIHINTIGIGGGSRFWGASLSEFDSAVVERNSMNYIFYKNNLKKVLGLFGKFNTNINSFKDLISKESSNIFLENSNNLNISDVFLAIDGGRCTGCGRCLEGCSEGAIWAADKSNFEGLNVNLIDDYIQEVIAIDGLINSLRGVSGSIYRVDSEVFLAANPVSNFKLLAQLSGINRSNIGCTPAFVFAIPRLRIPKNNYFFGMGVKTFSVINDVGHRIAYGNVYDGRALSFKDIRVFRIRENILDFIKKYIIKYFWLGAGFISSDNIVCKLTLIEGEIKFEIESDSRKFLMVKVKKYLKSSIPRNSFLFFKQPLPGSDLHYCDGIPEGLFVNSETGEVGGYSNLRVAGASNFKFLPPNSPTLSYMANAYGVGTLFIQGPTKK